jgi:hypothetical protein
MYHRLFAELTFAYLECTVYTDWLFVEGSVGCAFVYKIKFQNTASAALVSCIRPNSTPSTQLFYSFSNNFSSVTSFAETP